MAANTNYQLLVKFPTRGRASQFFSVLDIYYNLLEDKEHTHFLISCDEDDLIMNNEAVIEKLKSYHNLQICFSKNKSKIEAVNANFDLAPPFDIVLLASDDMVPQVKGYDTIIRTKMQLHFPDTDGIVWFNDGHQGPILNTLSILGKKYFDRFGYLYHPAYKSLWCDNEFTMIGNLLGKQKYFDQIIIKHIHPDIFSNVVIDELYERNLKLDAADKAVFEKRKSNAFDLGFIIACKIKLKRKVKKYFKIDIYSCG